jgi:hypothetical protein
MKNLLHYTAPNARPQDLVSHLREWFTMNDFNVQALKSEDGGDVLQVAKKGDWRKLVGLSTALNVVLRQHDSELSVEIGEGRWTDKAAAGAISLAGLWPLAVSAAIGAWDQIKLPERVAAEIENYLGSVGARREGAQTQR